MGGLFKIDLTSANTVHKVSKPTSALWLPRTAFITFVTLLMSLSQTPDMWLAAGGWKRLSSSGQLYHSTSRECNSLLMHSLFKSRIGRRSCFSAPVKFVPLSDHTYLGQPRTEINRTKAWMKVSVSSELTSSVSTARLLKHTNIQPFIFTVLRLRFP